MAPPPAAEREWTLLQTTSSYISIVGGSSPNDVYFAGEGETLLHYDGSGLFRSMFFGGFGESWNWDDIYVVSSGAVFLVQNYYGYVHRGFSEWFLGDWVDAVCAISARDAFVVGGRGRIYRLNGDAWTPMTSGTTNTLSDVWASSGDDVFAVGEVGTICHYDGAAWSVMPQATSNSLHAVWGSSGSDVFAVGDAGTILHYDRSSWHSLKSPTDQGLLSVWGSSPSDVFAVGPSVLLHYDGKSWSEMKGPPGISIWGSSHDDVYLIDGSRIWSYGI